MFIILKCTKHPHLRWSTDVNSVSAKGCYTGKSPIQFLGHDHVGDLTEVHEEACTCPVRCYTFANPVEHEKWREANAENA